MSERKQPRVVIIGGGFGGLQVARGLATSPVQVTLIDRRNHHCFQPLLYQVATAALSPADIASPIRHILKAQSNTEVIMGEVQAVDLDGQMVDLGKLGKLSYDYLVVATGATHAYFGNDEWAQHAPGLKTVEDAVEMRRRTLLAFESAEMEDDPAAQRAKLTFVVVGGGPTGVELAGALREIAANSIPADFRRVNTTTTRIVLVEGKDRVLPAMSEEASARALRDLEKLGVEVRTGALVTHIDEHGCRLGEEQLPAGNVFWAAGVRGSSLARTLGTPLDRAGRAQVQPDCSLPGHPEAFVVGDLAAQVSASDGKPVPGVAQGALQMGQFVARIIDTEVRTDSSSRPVFSYRDKGSMATIGKAHAVADIGGRTLGGVVAWLLWGVVHILFLVGFRNRLFVLLSWLYTYLVHSRGARLITDTGLVQSKSPSVTSTVESRLSRNSATQWAAPTRESALQ